MQTKTPVLKMRSTRPMDRKRSALAKRRTIERRKLRKIKMEGCSQ